ncbi:MAG: hypothetical protein IK065_05280 [Neisseriaceae bacterium]|nr:hypothetical protein [Neisseriaceae bacterium]
MGLYDAAIDNYLNEQGIDKQIKKIVREQANVLGILLQHANTESILPETLWKTKNRDDSIFDLSNYWQQNDDNTKILQNLYAVSDTVFGQHKCNHLSLFVVHNDILLRLITIGSSNDAVLNLGEDGWQKHLAARVATSAWLNICDDCSLWLQNNDLSGSHYNNAKRLWALPICRKTGGVVGVLYGEDKINKTWQSDLLASWIALAIVLPDLLENIQSMFTNISLPEK